jgi:hypothetical protein
MFSQYIGYHGSLSKRRIGACYPEDGNSRNLPGPNKAVIVAYFTAETATLILVSVSP